MLPRLSFLFSFSCCRSLVRGELGGPGKCCGFQIGAYKGTLWGPGAFSWVIQRGPESAGGAVSDLP